MLLLLQGADTHEVKNRVEVVPSRKHGTSQGCPKATISPTGRSLNTLDAREAKTVGRRRTKTDCGRKKRDLLAGEARGSSTLKHRERLFPEQRIVHLGKYDPFPKRKRRFGCVCTLLGCLRRCLRKRLGELDIVRDPVPRTESRRLGLDGKEQSQPTESKNKRRARTKKRSADKAHLSQVYHAARRDLAQTPNPVAAGQTLLNWQHTAGIT